MFPFFSNNNNKKERICAVSLLPMSWYGLFTFVWESHCEGLTGGTALHGQQIGLYVVAAPVCFCWLFLCERSLHMQGVICRNRPVLLYLQAVQAAHRGIKKGGKKNQSTVKYFQRGWCWVLMWFKWWRARGGGVCVCVGRPGRSSIALVSMYVSVQPTKQEKWSTCKREPCLWIDLWRDYEEN